MHKLMKKFFSFIFRMVLWFSVMIVCLSLYDYLARLIEFQFGDYWVKVIPIGAFVAVILSGLVVSVLFYYGYSLVVSSISLKSINFIINKLPHISAWEIDKLLTDFDEWVRILPNEEFDFRKVDNQVVSMDRLKNILKKETTLVVVSPKSSFFSIHFNQKCLIINLETSQALAIYDYTEC
ncbi:MAG: hypothetical protein HQL25_01550 [Candidatus Omnitrophica bacterium]|nr:hypothetical protein [Candidatus Omnitrophota bacterium]